MATLAMDREPEMAKFIDTYKFDQDMSYKRDKFGGGTSLPLNSDGYEDKQRSLKDERHQDWLHQQEKGVEYIPHSKTGVSYGPQSAADYEQEIQKMTDRYHTRYNEVLFQARHEPRESVYYRVGTPEQGFPGLGTYDKQRQQQNVVRQKEYNDLLRKQREAEKQKYEARRQVRAQPAQPQGPQMDYNVSQEQARDEEKRAYQDYMGKYQHPTNVPQKPPINYEENKKVLNEERKKEYNLLMEKKSKEERYWAMRGRPVTPPGGLNIGNYDRQVKEQAAQKKKDYKEMLDQQKAEQLKLRAFGHIADVSPSHVNYREEERPLVGSPRDINYYMHEKESRDKFRKDLRARPRGEDPASGFNNSSSQYPPLDDDPQFKAYIEVEKDKLQNKRKYAEELLQQQREHMYLRACQEPEVAVLDRSGPPAQYLANKPPPGPGYRPRDDPTRQTPRYWNEGKLSRGPPSQDSDVSRSNRSSAGQNGVPMAFRTESNRRPIPERPRHGQPPYHGEREQEGEKTVQKAIEQSHRSQPSPPKSPEKATFVRHRSPEKPYYNASEGPTPDLPYERRDRSPQKQYNITDPPSGRGSYERQSSPDKPIRDRSPERSRPPERPVDTDRPRTPPEWLSPKANTLQKPVDDVQIMGTPLAFKTQPYHPAPQQPPYSREGQAPYVNGFDGPPPPRPRSRRSREGEARPPINDTNQISPRRMMNTQYADSDDVTVKRKEANAERKKEYNDYLRIKSQERHIQEDARHAHMGKPAEVVKNAYYSSDDYEKFQRDLQKKQGEEYRDYLSKQYQPPPGGVGLPLGQYKYEPKRLMMEKQRNEEYNNIIKTDRSYQYQPSQGAEGLPLGQYKYEPRRLAMEAERNKDYNELLKKQHSNRPQQSAGGPQGLNIDVTFQHKKQSWLEKQRNRDYNEYLKKAEEEKSTRHQMPDPYGSTTTTYGSSFKQSPPSPTKAYHQTPPSPLSMRQTVHRAPPSPGSRHGHDVEMTHQSPPNPSRRGGAPQYDSHEQHMRQQAPPPHDYPHNGYRDMGDQYQQYNSFPSNQSDQGDYRAKMEDHSRPVPGTYQKQMTAAYPKAYSAPLESPATPSKLSLPLGQYDEMRPFIVKQRNKEYNSMKDQLSPQTKRRDKTRRTSTMSLPLGQYDEMRPQFEEERNTEYNKFLAALPPTKNRVGMTPQATDVTLPTNSDYMYEEVKRAIEKQRNREYNNLLQTGKIGKRTFREKVPTPPNQQGLPIGQQYYEPMHKAMEHQRNREYNAFLQQKYGGRTLRSTRSEPDPKTSFYYGNEGAHTEKKKVLDDERKNEYNQFVKELSPPPSKHFDIPTDVDSGLPIGQHHHEAWRKFLRNQRNMEYNQLVDVKGQETRNRDWNYQNQGVLELRGDDIQQSKQRELRAERQKEYNTYISQLKAPPSKTWPDPDGKAGYLGKEGAYEKMRQMYDEERRKDFMDAMQRSRENGYIPTPPRARTDPRGRYELNNPMIEALGRYEGYREELKAERKRDLQRFLSQARDEEKGRHPFVCSAPMMAVEESPLIHAMGQYETNTKQRIRDERTRDFRNFVQEQKHRSPPSTVRENIMPHIASAETPLVTHLGKYDSMKQKFLQQRHQDFHDFAEKHPALPSPETVRENLMPHVHWAEKPLVDYLGKYDLEQVKFRKERNKDSREYTEKKKHELRNPHDYYVFPTVAVAEKPLVEHMGKDVEQRQHDLKKERRRDYEQYQQQVAWKNKGANPPRREFGDPSKGPYNGLFQGLGEHGNNTDQLNQERRREYNEKLDQQYAGKERPHGRPNWVKEPLPNNVERSVRSPMRNPAPPDQYQQMLDEKRREEASMRRYEDPEYQDRLAHSRGEAPRHGY